MGDSEKHLKKYYMASKACPHLFCEECGSSIGPDLTVVTEHLGEDPRFALNVRILMLSSGRSGWGLLHGSADR